MKFQLPKQTTLNLKNKLTGAFGMKIAENAPCQKFWIGERNEQN